MEKQQIEDSVKLCIEALQAFNAEIDKLGSEGIMASMASVNLAPSGEGNFLVHVNSPVEIPLKAIMAGIENGVDMSGMNVEELAQRSVIPSCLILSAAFDSLSKRYADYAEKIGKEFPEAVSTDEGERDKDEEDQDVPDMGGGVERLPSQESGCVLG